MQLQAARGFKTFSPCPRVIQFSAPSPVGFLPPPETGEGWGGGEELGSPHTLLLPPIPAFPRTGGKGPKSQ